VHGLPTTQVPAFVDGRVAVRFDAVDGACVDDVRVLVAWGDGVVFAVGLASFTPRTATDGRVLATTLCTLVGCVPVGEPPATDGRMSLDAGTAHADSSSATNASSTRDTDTPSGWP